MAKEKATTTAGLLQVMFQGDVYKRSQGRIARQVTFGALLLLVLIFAWTVSTYGPLENYPFAGAHYAAAGVLAALGAWASYRVVNYAPFADFLIKVEAEMNKVSWPTRDELIKASSVVIFVIFFLAGVLFVFDLIWRGVFSFVL